MKAVMIGAFVAAFLSTTVRASDEHLKEPWQILSAIRDVVAVGANASEREKIRELGLVVNNDLRTGSVRLSKDSVSGHMSVTVGMGFFLRVRELAAAFAIESLVVHDDAYVRGYVAYLAALDPNSFGLNFLDAVAFAERYGHKDLAKQLQSNQEFEILQKSFEVSALAFALAHEYGHYVRGSGVIETTVVAERPSPEKLHQIIEEEIAADTWAIRPLVNAGFSPIGSTLVMMLLNESSLRFPAAWPTHPPSTSRSVRNMKSAIEYIQAKPHAFQKFLSKGLDLKRYGRILQSNLEMLEAWKDEQDARALLTTAELVERALANDPASQFRVAVLYSTGEDPALRYDLKKSLYWLEKAASTEKRYQLAAYADANANAAFTNAFVTEAGGSVEKACYFAKRAAAVGAVKGEFTLKKLNSTEKCS